MNQCDLRKAFFQQRCGILIDPRKVGLSLFRKYSPNLNISINDFRVFSK